METKNKTNPISFPFKIDEGELIKFYEKNVSFSIKNDDDETLEYTEGDIVLTTRKVIWFSLKHQKGIFFYYPNAITHGYEKLTLVCLLNYENEEEKENYIGVFGDPLNDVNIDEEEEEEKDIVLKKLKDQNKLTEDDNFVQILGSYKVEFEFDPKQRLTLLDVFPIFSKCSAMNRDNIDQTNNNNNFLNLLGISTGEMEDEDEDEEEVEEEENGENGNMDEENEENEKDLFD